jgi:hypothetical protein
MTWFIIGILIYIATVVLTWYPLVSDISMEFVEVWPDWEHFREEITLPDLVAGTLFSMIPAVNVIFVAIFIMSELMYTYEHYRPLRRRK